MDECTNSRSLRLASSTGSSLCSFCPAASVLWIPWAPKGRLVRTATPRLCRTNCQGAHLRVTIVEGCCACGGDQPVSLYSSGMSQAPFPKVSNFLSLRLFTGSDTMLGSFTGAQETSLAGQTPAHFAICQAVRAFTPKTLACVPTCYCAAEEAWLRRLLGLRSSCLQQLNGWSWCR